MSTSHTYRKCIVFCLLCILCSACASSSTSTTNTTTRAIPTPTATATGQAETPGHYMSKVLLQGIGRPDDMIFDQKGQLLFTDFYKGTISQLNNDGTAKVIFSNINGPEGIVVLPNGTLIVAEQRTNRILSFAPNTTVPTVLRTLPGTPSTAHCKDGVDGVAYDPTTDTLIIPDSPIGNVYRMSTDGKNLILLASNIVRPVGTIVDAQGNIFVADECGGAVWRITPDKNISRIGGFGMPDDVAFDTQGNMYVIDLAPAIHALIRVNLTTGQHETLAQEGFIEPQGLAIDKQNNIFVSDDYANVIVELSPA